MTLRAFFTSVAGFRGTTTLGRTANRALQSVQKSRPTSQPQKSTCRKSIEALRPQPCGGPALRAGPAPLAPRADRLRLLAERRISQPCRSAQQSWPRLHGEESACAERGPRVRGALRWPRQRADESGSANWVDDRRPFGARPHERGRPAANSARAPLGIACARRAGADQRRRWRRGAPDRVPYFIPFIFSISQKTGLCASSDD
jgi:hypothetical protein